MGYEVVLRCGVVLRASLVNKNLYFLMFSFLFVGVCITLSIFVVVLGVSLKR